MYEINLDLIVAIAYWVIIGLCAIVEVVIYLPKNTDIDMNNVNDVAYLMKWHKAIAIIAILASILYNVHDMF